MYLIDRSSNEKLLTKHTGPGSFYGEFSPNGDIYMASNLNRDKIAFGKLNGVEIEVLCEREDSELQGFIFNESGSIALLFWNVAGRNEVSVFDIQSQKELKTLEMPVELIGGGEFSSDDRYFVFTGSGSTEPANIWIYDFDNDTFSKLTNSPHPGINLEELIAPELVRFKSFDGLELSGWLYTPRIGNAPYPTIISYHGGPEGQGACLPVGPLAVNLVIQLERAPKVVLFIER